MNQDDLISNYLQKTLTASEQVDFDVLMQTDQGFANEVAFQQNLKKAITLNERNAAKKMLQVFESEKTNQKSVSKWYVAASIAAVFTISFWFLNQDSSSEQLFDSYYQTYPNIDAPTVRGTTQEDLKSKAFFEYDNGNYEKSVVLFAAINADEKKDFAIFYQGLSLMELQQYEKALVIFNEFETDKQSKFLPMINWYKALIFIQLNKKEEAKIVLKNLSISQNSQQELAKKLLEALE